MNCLHLKLLHYDENRIFLIEVIFKHKQVACMRRKMLFIIFKYLFSLQRYSSFKICKLRKRWCHTLNQITMMKKAISANLYQKCSILCSEILRNVLHNELNNFVTMATYQVSDLPNIKGFSALLCHFIFDIYNGAPYA